MLKHIHVRDGRDLVNYARDVLADGKTKRASLVHAIDAGRWTCLGKFSTVRLGRGWPGWIVRVESFRTEGKTWLVLVYCKEPDWSNLYVAVSTDPVPWDQWYLDGTCSDPRTVKLEIMDYDFLQER